MKSKTTMLKLVVLTVLMMVLALGAEAKGPRRGADAKVIAHRGYWDTEGSAQNSIRSLIKADSIGCWGSEFDVWMSKDGTLFVNHDPDINGVEIQNSEASKVAKEKLSNGEYIPTLEQMLKAAVNLPRLHLVCELKPHEDKKQEAKAVKRIVQMVVDYGLEKRTTFITFSYQGLKELIKQTPIGTEVYYLTGDLNPQQLKDLGAAGMDYNLGILHQHPDWSSQSHQLGLKVNVWTLDASLGPILNEMLDLDPDFITTNTPVEMMNIVFERGVTTYP